MSQVSLSLSVAGCMPMVMLNTFHAPCISGKLVVGSIVSINLRFDFLVRLPM